MSRRQNPASVMVWAAVTATGRSPLVFDPLNYYIDQDMYETNLPILTRDKRCNNRILARYDSTLR